MVNGVVASTVIWMAAVPLVALRFHIVSPISILLNIPLIPITSAALLFGGLGLGLSAVWGPLGGPASWTAGWLLEVTQWVVQWGVAAAVGTPLHGRAELGMGPGLLRAARTGHLLHDGRGAVVASRPAGTHRPLVAPVGMDGLGLLLAIIPTRPATPEAELLAVGHGLATIIRTPDGQTLLYDCGRMGDPTVGRRIIAPALWACGISRLDTVILSHADQDHFNGLPDLLDRFPHRDASGFPRDSADRPIRGRSSSSGTSDREESPSGRPRRRKPGSAAGVRFTVQHPPSGWYPQASDNARSLVLDVDHAGRHLLLTGDLEQLGLIDLIARPTSRAAARGHAGPPPRRQDRPTRPRFTRWANPRSVVVSQRTVPSGSERRPVPARTPGYPRPKDLARRSDPFAVDRGRHRRAWIPGKSRCPARGEERVAPCQLALGFPDRLAHLLVLAGGSPHRGRPRRVRHRGNLVGVHGGRRVRRLDAGRAAQSEATAVTMVMMTSRRDRPPSPSSRSRSGPPTGRSWRAAGIPRRGRRSPGGTSSCSTGSRTTRRRGKPVAWRC